jgi:hypothetical protein
MLRSGVEEVTIRNLLARTARHIWETTDRSTEHVSPDAVWCGTDTIPTVMPELVPQLVGNDGIRAMQAAIADPDAWAMERTQTGSGGTSC